VELLDQADAAGSGASGNPAGILKPILTPAATSGSRLSFLAFDYFLSAIEKIPGASGPGGTFRRTGLLQAPRGNEEAGKFQKALRDRGISASLARWLAPTEASELAGSALEQGAVYFPSGGWVDPSKLCARLFEELERAPRFRWLPRLRIDPERTEWLDHLEGAPHAVVFCVAESSRLLPEFAALRTQVIRGQISELALVGAPPKVPIAFHDYVIPRTESSLVFGATHDRGEETLTTRWEDHLRVLDRILAVFPKVLGPADLERAREPGASKLRAALRFTTAAHLPVVAALGPTSERLGVPSFCLSALGSRGILLAPILARHLAWLVESRLGREAGEPVFQGADADLAGLLAAGSGLISQKKV
jgi:tRNA 5-methylaminomethyl-2-thiouridine biosynthesis bifunctional protein